MNYRKIAVRVLYYSLAVAALTGITAVFIPANTSILLRLLATAISTGVSAALMLGAVRAIENPRTRPLGTMIGAIICIVLPLVFGTIWLGTIKAIPDNKIKDLGFTALIVFLCGMPLCLGACAFTHNSFTRAGKTLQICWIILPILWIIDQWTNTPSQLINSVTIPIACSSFIGALLMIRWPKSSIAIVFLFITCVLWQWVIYNTPDDLHKYKTLLAILFVSAWIPCVFALFTLLTIRKQVHAIKGFEITGVILGSIAVALCFAYAWTDLTNNESHLLFRLAIASSILGGTSVLGVFITQALRVSMLVTTGTIFMEAICPRCGDSLSLHQGKNQCPRCSLRFKILFESPNCRVCEYDLAQTASDRCPECGEKISTCSIQ